MTDSDKIWREDADRHGWVMPAAPRWKRLVVIRHIRAIYHRRRAEQFRGVTRALGLGIGGVPQFDRWVIYGIARGYERDLKDRQP